MGRGSSAPGRACDLVATLEETLFLLQQSEEYRPAIHVGFEKTVETLAVQAERDRLKQIFWNIGLNAFQAMPRGGTLTVIVRAEEGFGAVEFHDSGEGIPADQLSRIFEPFYTTKSRGTGLGLAIAKRLVEDLGGRIEVKCPPAGGATFRIYFRRHAEVTSDEASTSTLSPATGPR